MDLVVGAPGDHENGVASSGAIYILSIQRDIVLRYRAYNYLPLALGLGAGLLAALLIALFCWLFRRKGTTRTSTMAPKYAQLHLNMLSISSLIRTNHCRCHSKNTNPSPR